MCDKDNLKAQKPGAGRNWQQRKQNTPKELNDRINHNYRCHSKHSKK